MSAAGIVDLESRSKSFQPMFASRRLKLMNRVRRQWKALLGTLIAESMCLLVERSMHESGLAVGLWSANMQLVYQKGAWISAFLETDISREAVSFPVEYMGSCEPEKLIYRAKGYEASIISIPISRRGQQICPDNADQVSYPIGPHWAKDCSWLCIS